MVASALAPLLVAGGTAVTFDGTVVLEADPATNGTMAAYNLTAVDDASDPAVTLTGRVGSHTDTETGTSNGTLSVAGDLAPTNATATINWSAYSVDPDTGFSGDSGDGVSWYLSNPPMHIERVCADPSDPDSGYQSFDGEVWIAEGNTTGDGNHTDGTKVGTYSGTEDEAPLCAGSLAYTTSGSGVTVQLHDGDAQNDQSTKLREVRGRRPTDGKASIDGTTYNVSHGVEFDVTLTTGSVSVDAWPTDGERGGISEWELTYTERAATTAPAVEVNNGSVSYAGTLSAGETTNLTGNAAWLQQGRNRVNVTVGDGSLSADAPDPIVGVHVEHSAAADQSVSATVETWSERYNVSRTWGSSRTGATLTVPFSGDVVSVRSAEVRVNGSSWSAVPPSDVSMDSTTATVHLGDVGANATTTVRVNGSKAPAASGAYHVVDPTLPGEALATEIEVDNGTDLAIEVGGTPDGDRLHYLSNTSWDAAETATVHADGRQVLRLPGASDGDRATVRTLPLEVRPDTGEVVVEPVEPDGSPEFRVSPGAATGDEVTLRWHQTVRDHRYVLLSVTHDAARDDDVAESPVDLVDDDSSELLRIFDAGLVEQSSSEDPPPGGPVSSSGTPLESTPVLFASVLFGLAGVSWAARRWLSAWQQVALLVVGSAGALAVLAERASREAVLARLVEPVGAGLGEATPVLALAGVALLGYVVYKGVGSSGTTIQIRGRFRR